MTIWFQKRIARTSNRCELTLRDATLSFKFLCNCSHGDNSVSSHSLLKFARSLQSTVASPNVGIQLGKCATHSAARRHVSLCLTVSAVLSLTAHHHEAKRATEETMKRHKKAISTEALWAPSLLFLQEETACVAGDRCNLFDLFFKCTLVPHNSGCETSALEINRPHDVSIHEVVTKFQRETETVSIVTQQRPPATVQTDSRQSLVKKQ